MIESEKQELDSRKEEYQRKRYKENLNIRIEMIIWILIAGIVGWKLYYNAIKQEYFNQNDLINIILVSSMVIIIPILSRTIFGVLPLQFLRKLSEPETKSFSDNPKTPKINSLDNSDSKIKEDEYKYFNSEEYLISLSVSSDKLSKKLFTRSSSYLFIGSIIAIIGIVYFSYQSIEIVQLAKPNWEMLIQFLPRFGALFFIEFVAFFFLKQYRITMDDFKYYESIKRQRESNLVILKLQSDSKYTKDKEKLELLIKNLDLFSNPTLLKENESTEFLENRKFSNEELNIMNNIIEQISKVKK